MSLTCYGVLLVKIFYGALASVKTGIQMLNVILRVVTPCSLLEAYQHFGSDQYVTTDPLLSYDKKKK
jgi:hypothetical protein